VVFGVGVSGHALRDFELAVVRQIVRDTGGAESMAADGGFELGIGGAALNHVPRVHLTQAQIVTVLEIVARSLDARRRSWPCLKLRMRVLFDHSTPVPLRRCLTGHTVRKQFNKAGSGFLMLICW
jgi:hypothetical protein